MAALVQSEASCLRSKVDKAAYDYMTHAPALAFATKPYFLITSCIETDREADIVVALIAEALGGFDAETEWCVRDEILENYGADPRSSLSLMPAHLGCLNEEQMLELSVYELSGKAGGVNSNAYSCLRKVMSGSNDAAERLQSGNPQDSMAISIAFQEAAIFGCLTNEQVASILEASTAESGPRTECLRHLYTQDFPRLYNEFGPVIFGSALDLAPEERAAVESFLGLKAQCADNPPGIYPTPDAPAPTLRLGTQSEPQPTPDDDTTLKDYVATKGPDRASCLREHIPRMLPDHDTYMARPQIVIVNHHGALARCLGQDGMVNAIASVLAEYVASINDVRDCLHREFNQLSGYTEYHVFEYPHWLYHPPYLRCLTQEDYQAIAVAQLEAVAGKVDEDSRNCVGRTAAEAFNIARVVDIGYGMEYFGIAAMTLCLSDERLIEVDPGTRFYHEWPWPPRDRECVRREYNEMVVKLRLMVSNPNQSTDASQPVRGFYTDARNCAGQP